MVWCRDGDRKRLAAQHDAVCRAGRLIRNPTFGRDPKGCSSLLMVQVRYDACLVLHTISHHPLSSVDTTEDRPSAIDPKFLGNGSSLLLSEQCESYAFKGVHSASWWGAFRLSISAGRNPAKNSPDWSGQGWISEWSYGRWTHRRLFHCTEELFACAWQSWEQEMATVNLLDFDSLPPVQGAPQGCAWVSICSLATILWAGLRDLFEN